jgi:hypothetical protein
MKLMSDEIRILIERTKTNPEEFIRTPLAESKAMHNKRVAWESAWTEAKKVANWWERFCLVRAEKRLDKESVARRRQLALSKITTTLLGGELEENKPQVAAQMLQAIAQQNLQNHAVNAYQQYQHAQYAAGYNVSGQSLWGQPSAPSAFLGGLYDPGK